METNEHKVVRMHINKNRTMPSDICKYSNAGIIAATKVTPNTFPQTLYK